MTPAEWTDDLDEDADPFASLGDRMPAALFESLDDLRHRVQSMGNATF